MSTITDSYKHCQQIVNQTYENFPVASWFLPRKLREPITAIYAFARTADDFADEGDLSKEIRLAKIADYKQNIMQIEVGETPSLPIFIALQDSIQKFKLPTTLFLDLLAAFKQDVQQNRYQTFSDVLEYCKLSANPIGRLLLHLTDNATISNIIAADALCTQLQLLNFLQDVYSDLKKRNRLYLPVEHLTQYNVTCANILNKVNNDNYQLLVDQHLCYIKELQAQANKLGENINGKFGFQIRIVLQCAKELTNMLEKRKNLYNRPVINKFKLLKIFFTQLLSPLGRRV